MLVENFCSKRFPRFVSSPGVDSQFRIVHLRRTSTTSGSEDQNQLFRSTSELKFERQLDRARAANLVQRVEAAIRETGAQAACQRLRGVTEQRIG